MALRKKTTAATADTITINEALLESGQHETAFRLALSYVRPDDFDTVKAIPMLDYQATIKQFQGTQSQLPDTESRLPEVANNTSESLENLQKLTQSEQSESSQNLTQQQQTELSVNGSQINPQNTLSLPRQQQHLTAPTQSPTSNAQLTLIDQLARQAEQEIQLVDAISQVKNQIILNNLAVRESELTEQVNQRWLNQKQGYLGSIRGLADLAQQKPEVTPDENDLTQEIEGIIAELGKKLIA